MKLEWVTPQMAAEWLCRSVEVPHDAALVSRFAEDMRKGRWAPARVEAPIVFDVEDGHLVDGRLRLLAVIEAADEAPTFAVYVRGPVPGQEL